MAQNYFESTLSSSQIEAILTALKTINGIVKCNGNGTLTQASLSDIPGVPMVASDIGAVSYNANQVLTDAQKKQARDNADVQIKMIKGSGAPTSALPGVEDQLYRDIETDYVYVCTEVNGSTYTWAEI